MKSDASSGLIQRWVRPEIQALNSYSVADASGMIKLDAMENPYSWPESLREEWASLLTKVQVNRYPDPRAPQLEASLRSAMSVSEEMALLLGNGSDEIIQMIIMALSGPDRVVMSVDPGFVMYRMIATYCGARYCGVPLRTDFSLDMPALLQAMEELQPAVLFLAYPNNPTGNLFSRAEIEQVIAAAPGLVVVDEAYAPFADDSFMEDLGRFDNLVLMRTLSKMGLAGLRLGYLVGSPQWVSEFDKVRMPYNINVLTQASASFALRHLTVFEEQTALIRSERQRLFDALRQLDGVCVFPSQANFLLVRLPAGMAGAIFDGMKRQGVLVKRLDGAHPLLADCLRLTVGTPDENGACLRAMSAQL